MKELFSEIYGCYYTVVADILRRSYSAGLTATEIDRIVEEKAFSESCFHLIPRLMDGQWDVLQEEGGRYRSKLKRQETKRPVSHLEKRWIKALTKDRRVGLFFTTEEMERMEGWLKGVEPLFDWGDLYCFDQAADGDCYEDPRYRHHFRQILEAIREGKTIWVNYSGGKGGERATDVLPLRMMYSERDDKFRVLCVQSWKRGQRHGILNVARILAVRPSRWKAPQVDFEEYWKGYADKNTVAFLIKTRRNALERAMLQFAAYQKATVYLEERDCYLCRLQYDRQEETELLIRLLSFGPLVEVLSPEPFRREMKRRIDSQIRLMEAPL